MVFVAVLSTQKVAVFTNLLHKLFIFKFFVDVLLDMMQGIEDTNTVQK